jgi:hypothetical protein
LPTLILPDAPRRGGDRGLIREVELEGAGVRSDAFRGRFPVLKVVRPHEHDEAVRHQILCDLKTDSFVCPGYQGDRLSCMAISFFASLVRRSHDEDPAHARRNL